MHPVNGAMRTLPQDFSGQYNVVLLAFTQQQQYAVDTWTPHLDAMRRDDPKLNVYELPTVPHMPFWERRMVDFWMFTGISDPDVRNRTITLYTDVEAFISALGLPDTQTIYILLVDNQGNITWRTRGAYDPTKLEELKATIAEMQVKIS